jgi:hypothetical protein
MEGTMLRYAELTNLSNQVRELTSRMLEAFATLVRPFEAAFQAHMQGWTMTGQPLTARSFTVHTNCPLPPSEDRLLFMVSYLPFRALTTQVNRSTTGAARRTATP